jgi:serine/threonine-protein kinase
VIDPLRRRIEELALAAESLAPERRERFLREQCGDDAELRAEVEALVARLEEPLTFLDGSALDVPVPLEPHAILGRDPMLGRRVGAYRLDALIGAGGMGAVYRASRQDGLLQHQVAIKVLHRKHAEGAEHARFQAEWQTLAKLGHPNIARLLDAGRTADGIPYLVMELVDGAPIDEYCDAHRLSLDARIRLFQQVARAVHFAHQNLVVHRDLKPANILVTGEGVPKLLDFGIAKVLDPAAGEHDAALTGEWARALTPDYASPEQLRGDAVSTASDVYPLGVVLYELLTGKRPYRFETARREEIERILRAATPRPSAAASLRDPGVAARRRSTPGRVQRRLRGDLDAIVSVALREDPARRYASAAELADDLQRHLDFRPVRARPDRLLYRTAKHVRRNRLAVGAAAALVLALALGIAATSWQARRTAEQAELASAEAESAQQMTDFLVDSFLVSARRREPQETLAIHGTIERQAETVRLQYGARARLRANLLDALGRAAVACDLHDVARGLIDEAAEIRARAFGPRSAELARSLGSRGGLAFAEGDYARAAEVLAQALALQRGLPPEEQGDLARSANDLAVALRKLGRLDEAEALHREALARRRAAFGENHHLVAESLNNLGAILLERAEYESAAAVQREVLAIRRATLGERHPLVAQALSNLGTVLCHTGGFAQGIPLIEQAAEVYRGLAGADRGGLARTLSTLAAARHAVGRLEPARLAADEALAALGELLGEGHPDVATALLTSARLEGECGRNAHAAELAARAVAIYRAHLPSGHERIAIAANDHGSYLLDSGDAAAAEPLLREAHAIFSGSGRDTRFSVSAAVNLGKCLDELGRSDEAEKVLRAELERLSDAGAGEEWIGAVEAQLRECGRRRSG